MRLLLTTDTVGGVWDYTVTLARAIERDGHALVLAVVGSPTDEQIAQLPEEIAIECRSHRLEWLLASRRDLTLTAEWLARLSAAWGAELVHLNQMAYAALARFAAPTVVAVHSDACSWFGEVRGTPPPAEWHGYLEMVRAGLDAATVVVVPSGYQGDLVRRHYGRTVDAVIHNGIEPPAVGPTQPPREPLLLSAGRAWDDAKGMAIFDRAVATLGADAPPAHLLGPLEGPDGSRFEATAVTCHGRVGGAELRGWMSRATVYVGASLYEPFGLAPLEAAAHGCTLALSDIGSFRELWDGCADFFPSGSASGLARSIEGLLTDGARARELATAARDRALSRYTASSFAERYLELYRAQARHGAAGAAPVSRARSAAHAHG